MNRQAFSHPLLALALLGASALSGGCAVAAVTAGAMVLNDEFQDRAQAAVVPVHPELAYKSTLSTLSSMTEALIHRDDDVMAMQTRVDYGQVTVHVREISNGETEVRVLAEKALLYNAELSALVLDRITNDLSTLRRQASSVQPASMSR